MDKAQPTTELSRKIPSLHNIKPRTPEQVQAMHEMFKEKIAAAQKGKAGNSPVDPSPNSSAGTGSHHDN